MSLNVNAKEWVPFNLQPKKYLQALKSKSTNVSVTFSNSGNSGDPDTIKASSSSTHSMSSNSKNVVIKSLSTAKRSKMNELIWEEKARLFSEKEKEKEKEKLQKQKQKLEMSHKTKTDLHVWNSVLRMKPQYDSEPQYSIIDHNEGNADNVRSEFRAEQEIHYTIDECWQAIVDGDENVSQYLERNFDWFSEKNGYNALHIASMHGHVKFVILALRSGISAKTKTREKKYTALHLLAMKKTNLADRLQCASILIQNGAECSTRDRNGENVIHVCARKGFYQLLQHLLHHSKRQHLRLDDLNCNKESALMIVVSMPASFKYLECINLFLIAGATVDEAFITAFISGNVKAVGKILNSNSAIFSNRSTGPDRERWKQLLPLALLRDDIALLTMLVDGRIIIDDLLTLDNDWVHVVLNHSDKKCPLISMSDIEHKYPSFCYSQYDTFSSLRSIGSHELLAFSLFLGNIEGFKILSKDVDRVNWKTALHAALCSPCPHRAVSALNDLAIASIKRRDDRRLNSSSFDDHYMLEFPLRRVVNGVLIRPVSDIHDEVVPIIIHCFSMTIKSISESQLKQKRIKEKRTNLEIQDVNSTNDNSNDNNNGDDEDDDNVDDCTIRQFDRFLEALVVALSYCPPSTAPFRLMHNFRSSCLRYSERSHDDNWKSEFIQRHRSIEKERRMLEREKGNSNGKGGRRGQDIEQLTKDPETLFDLSRKAVMHSLLYPINKNGICSSSWDALYTADMYRHCKEEQGSCFDTIRDIAAEKCLSEINIHRNFLCEGDPNEENEDNDKGEDISTSIEQAKQILQEVLSMCLPLDEWID